MEASRASVTPNWKGLYQAAVLELNAQKALQRIHEAESVIASRMEDVTRSGDTSEAEQLLNALNALRDLRDLLRKG